MRAPAIRLEAVSVAYERCPAVARVSGAFPHGSLTAVTGPNGAGKTTLLKALMGELPLSGGLIDRGGLTIRDFAYLPQAADIDRHFPLTVSDTVVYGAWRDIGAFRRVNEAGADRARRALVAVGLDGLERRPIGALSAGQFQRVLFARLLLQDARIIILDEPFTAIDARTTTDLLGVIRGWNAEGRTVIAVLHDFDQVRAHFPRTLLMARQTVAWGVTEEALSPANLQRARALAERWEDRNDEAEGRRCPA